MDSYPVYQDSGHGFALAVIIGIALGLPFSILTLLAVRQLYYEHQKRYSLSGSKTEYYQADFMISRMNTGG
jgi:hypothetical protein